MFGRAHFHCFILKTGLQNTDEATVMEKIIVFCIMFIILYNLINI